MAHLTFAELITHGVPVSPSEAAALTLAVARVFDGEPASATAPFLMPDATCIILSSSGHVSLVDEDHGAAVEQTVGLALLLRQLLRLDDSQRTSAEAIPGGMLVLLARSLGEMDLPPVRGEEFRKSLERFAFTESTVLASVFWRAARMTPGLRQPARRERVASPPAAKPEDRRQRGPSRADLRRSLREVERQLFEIRRADASAAPAKAATLPATSGPAPARRLSPPLVLRVAVAALVLMAALAAGAAIGGVRGNTSPSLAEIAPSSAAPAGDGVNGGDRADPAADRHLTADDGRPASTPVTSVDTRAVQRVRARDARNETSRRPSHAGQIKSKRPAPASFPGGARSIPFAVPAA